MVALFPLSAPLNRVRFGTANSQPPGDAPPSNPSAGSAPRNERATYPPYTLPPEVVQQFARVAETRTQAFAEEFQTVLNEAQQYLETYAQTNDPTKSAVVMDLDETLLDNSAYEISKLAGDTSRFRTKNQWLKLGEAPAIPASKTFAEWVLSKGFKLCFVTARQEFLREATERNLNRIGLTSDQFKLYMKTNRFQKGAMGEYQPANEFKVACQQQIEASGLKVAALIGDQESDVQNCLGRGFKLPNPVYFVA
jgi:predicted secreted acid phosphatase